MEQVLKQFKTVTRSYTVFHIVFFSLGLLELVSFILFFSFFTKSSLVAFALAAILLTVFSYFVLLFYYQGKKPEQLFELRKQFLLTHKDPQTTIASTLDLIEQLDRLEYTYYRLPKYFTTLSPLLQKFSCWSHWKDVHQMKELLLLSVIEQTIEIVKERPLDLQSHSSLGDAFMELSKLYTDPGELRPTLWTSSEYQSPEMKERFTKAAEKALIEFQIVKHFAPQNAWVHAKLASIYKSLGRSKDEIREYEAILQLSPQDKEVLLCLGILYFQVGQTAQALEIYEQLKQSDDPAAAQELISHYL